MMDEARPEVTRSIWVNFRDVIFDPTATFAEVAERPRWLAPLLVTSVAVAVVSALMMPLYEAMQAQQLQSMPAEQREQARAAMAAFKWVGIAVAPIAVAAITALSALLFWTWGAIAGARNAEYRVAFAAVIYAGVVVFLQSVLQAVVLAIKGAEQIAREGGPPTFGLALFLERGDMGRIAWGQIENVNFFSIWYAVLLGMAGVHAIGMSRGPSIAFAIAMFVIGGFLQALQPG